MGKPKKQVQQASTSVVEKPPVVELTDEELKALAERWADSREFFYNAPVNELARGVLALMEKTAALEATLAELGPKLFAYEAHTAIMDTFDDTFRTLAEPEPQ